MPEMPIQVDWSMLIEGAANSEFVWYFSMACKIASQAFTNARCEDYPIFSCASSRLAFVGVAIFLCLGIAGEVERY